MMNNLTNDRITLSFYQYDDIEKKFINLIIELCQKYPFKFNFLMKKVISSHPATYIKDTTMIINLNIFLLNQQQIIFQFIRRLINIKAVTKVISKKEFLIIHFYSNLISELFRYPTRWLGYIFCDTFRALYPDDQCHLGVLLKKENNRSDYVDLYLERLETPFIVVSDYSENKSLDTKNVKKIYLFSTDANYCPPGNNKQSEDSLEYCYNTEKFKISVKNYFDNPLQFHKNYSIIRL